MKSILIVGYGVIGTQMKKVFPHADIHDPAKNYDRSKNSNIYDIVFICVPTDSLPDGGADISIVCQVVMEWQKRARAICIKSTVPPGTTQKFIDMGLPVVMSPEFFGTTPSSKDVDHDFVILGGDPDVSEIVASAYKEIKSGYFKIHKTDCTTAELVKYGENAWIGMKVIFCNEFYRMCKAFGVDYSQWRELWLADKRISPSHTWVFDDKPYAKSHCITKDMEAIIHASLQAGYYPAVLDSAWYVNLGWIEEMSEPVTKKKARKKYDYDLR
jgi:UDPglucose 6-dehydrogenase